MEARNQRTGTPAYFNVPWWEVVFFKKAVLKNFALSTGNTCVGVRFLKSCRPLDLQLYEKDTPAQVFSCEYFRIFSSTYFEKHLQTAAI